MLDCNESSKNRLTRCNCARIAPCQSIFHLILNSTLQIGEGRVENKMEERCEEKMSA